MADTKISALSSASAPAGTEELAITQSSTNKKIRLDAMLTFSLPHDLKFVDATYDVGKSGATRPRDGFFSRNVTVGGILTPVGLVDCSGAGAGQVKFPATENTSANANTFTDCEKGTWTPAPKFGGAFVGGTAISYANYTKNGNVCTVTGRFDFSAVGSSTGQLTCDGLPFAALNDTYSYGVGTYWKNGVHGAIWMNPNGTSIANFYKPDGSVITEADISNGQLIIFTMTYLTN